MGGEALFYLRAPGVLIETLEEGESVAYSALSGESHILNETSAAIIDLLDEKLPMSTAKVAAALADEATMRSEEVTDLLSGAWETLLQSGLVRLGPSANESQTDA